MSRYFIYMVRCADGSVYTGITTDVARRMREHSGEAGKGAKYTARHRVIKIEALWSADGRSAASKLEYFIKSLPKAEKEALIADPGRLAGYGDQWQSGYQPERATAAQGVLRDKL